MTKQEAIKMLKTSMDYYKAYRDAFYEKGDVALFGKYAAVVDAYRNAISIVEGIDEPKLDWAFDTHC